MILTLFVNAIILRQLAAAEDLSGVSFQDRIYNGMNAAKGQFPFMARTLLAHRFTNVTHSYTVCGASLISDRWVVSAAHCAVGAVSASITLGMLNTDDYTGTQTFEVPESGIFIHPQYNPTKSPSPDIVLYHLPSPVSFNNNIKPIQLPNLSPNSVSSLDGFIATVVGWGRTQTGQGSRTLLYANIKVMKSAECIQRFPPGATNATICTDRRYKNSGPCPGDSGGPLTVNGRNGPQLVGITSFAVGSPPCEDPNGGDVYTYVPFYRDWIQKTMASH